MNESEITIIEGEGRHKLVDWRELHRYRDLLFFLVWRDVKTRYAQSVLGIGWAVIQPLFSMVVFTIVFGGLAKVDSDGAPYAVFSFAALVPWTFFSNSLNSSSSSLIASSNLLTKVYFPRLIIPVAPVFAKLVDFGIAFVLLLLMLLWFRIRPNAGILMLPYLIIVMMATAAGMGMWLTALSIKYRDVQYAMAFSVTLLMYAAPVVYPVSAVPQQFLLLYSLFPMAGVIEGFRSALLGTVLMPWDMIAVGSASALVLFVTGAIYFRSMEKTFADVA
ncbi:MAG: ABC transporter permease [Anaerolineae bacterium]|nr:ABC transporter permease [Anaerolineae bacterium]MCO5199940.1 ABC transporter permease [Anaerolineae bacterium]